MTHSSIPSSAPHRPRAVLLLSGGLDSSTLLALAIRDGFDVYAMSFRYGQRHAHELAAAKKIAESSGVAAHVVVDIDLRIFGGSALTADIDVPKDRAAKGIPDGVPITYVPARNTIFLSYALAWAEVLGAHDIFIGVNARDYSGYPDCRPAFIAAFEALAAVATAAGVGGARYKVHTPLITMTKAEIITAGLALGLDYGLTHSCYDPAPDGRPCRRCDSCVLRAAGFAEAGAVDPVLAR